jgi:hypothetical protein
MDGLLGEQLIVSVTSDEADVADGIRLRSQRSDGDPCILCVYLDDWFCSRSLAEGTVAFDQVIKASAHAQAVRTPRFDAYHFVTAAPGERAGIVEETRNADLVVRLRERREHSSPFRLTVVLSTAVPGDRGQLQQSGPRLRDRRRGPD